VLNASYEILNITRWQRALCLIFSGKAEVLEVCDKVLHSPSVELSMPSVIRMHYYVTKPRQMVPFSRSNVFLRDRYTCQYCGAHKKPLELTLDHIVPRSAAGDTCWENVVTACKKCNTKKGDRTPEDAGMKLMRKPRTPQYTPSLNTSCRAEWGKYLPYKIQAIEPVLEEVAT
jgi:5-methylcytosine-specific restriction endonuclease McrA